jgi:putative solute:sodium symporter small subunit
VAARPTVDREKASVRRRAKSPRTRDRPRSTAYLKTGASLVFPTVKGLQRQTFNRMGVTIMDQIERIRKRQLRFALGVGIPYFAFVIGIFLLVYLASAWVTGVSILGFPLHYWLVAIAIYPITWALFIWYVASANRIEDEIAETLEGE